MIGRYTVSVLTVHTNNHVSFLVLNNHTETGMAMAMETLLRIEEVSELTGIPVNTLRFWRSTRGGPQSAKLGRRIVYRERDVQAWIDAQFATAGGPDAA
jgi:predicted DNA-binding transcriptional regulator AlpA